MRWKGGVCCFLPPASDLPPPRSNTRDGDTYHMVCITVSVHLSQCAVTATQICSRPYAGGESPKSENSPSIAKPPSSSRYRIS